MVGVKAGGGTEGCGRLFRLDAVTRDEGMMRLDSPGMSH
jgi:hypothetical protein